MMPLYYLHIRNGSRLELDPEGTELPNLEAAVDRRQSRVRAFTACAEVTDIAVGF
jgi:hypothetical protein